ncbi:MAG: hypothetical protein M0R77_10370 [Gammaproteobacteria bacterium]|nr:hypothetical protein [Gammaproteobacteria bacterium]
MARKIFTPEEMVLARVDQYPSLYSAKTFDEAKLRVYDQFFNVIGNGIRDEDELAAELKAHQFDRERAIRFCNGEQAYYGYLEVRMIGDFPIGEGESITVGDWERDEHPEVKHWMECSYCRWTPYPNFQKQYSAIWFPNFRKVAGDEWVNAAVWYYGKCRDWFLSPDSNRYWGAYPSDKPQKDAQYLADMYKQRDRYESDEAFSAAYGLEYTGDMVDFMTRRSQKQRVNALEYIEETLKEFG